MPFPKTLTELKAAGYVYDGQSPCRACGVTIHWWITPNNKSMPMDVSQDDNVTSHWSTCPKAKDFKTK
jgi:hypothetical protein